MLLKQPVAEPAARLRECGAGGGQPEQRLIRIGSEVEPIDVVFRAEHA